MSRVSHRNRIGRASAAVLLWVALLLPGALQAQQQITMSAQLPIASPTGNGTRNLGFGSITPTGTPQTVIVTTAAATSGEYRFDVSSNRGVTFGMSMPTQLTSPGLTPLEVSFNDAAYGAWCVTSGTTACTRTSFNPAAGAVTACAHVLGNGNCHQSRAWGAGSTLAVYVGGALAVPAVPLAGTYEATITLTITQVY